MSVTVEVTQEVTELSVEIVSPTSDRTSVEIVPGTVEHVIVQVEESLPVTGQYTFERVSEVGELSALRVVSETTDGKVEYTNPMEVSSVDSIAGVTITSGSVVSVQRDGFINTSGLGLPKGVTYVGVNGTLQSDPPTSGHLVSMGSVVSENRLYLKISDTVALTEEP